MEYPTLHTTSTCVDCISQTQEYLLHSAWVIQLQFGNDTASLQCCSRPLHIVNTTRLHSCEGHYHLHHLEYKNIEFTSIQSIQQK